MRAQRGDVTGAAGQMAKAVIEEAHARLSARSRWVLNEKGIVEAAGLGEAHTLFSRVPSEPRALVGWVDDVGAALRSSDGKGRDSSPTATWGIMDRMELRDTLFGDVPLSSWVSEPRPSLEPWATFAQARDALAAGRASEAVDRLQAVAAMPALESRHYLQAWHVLRELGVRPASEIAKAVYGVVVEVSLPNGLDVLAAYADGRARYLNWSGAAVIWDAPGPRFGAQIAGVLNAGKAIVQRIGPWESPRRGPPPTGHVRLNLLTPSGLHFGEGPLDVLGRDALAGPLLAAATGLMQGLTSLPRQQTPGAPER